MMPSKQLQPHESATYLGVTSHVNCSQEAQYRVLLDKEEHNAINLSKINMYHYYSHIYNNYSIIPRIPYPLAASSLTNNHFNKLHVALYSAIIASKGFNRHFPIPLRYGLHKYSGLGILDLEVQQGIRKKSNTSQFNLPSQTPNFNTRNN